MIADDELIRSLAGSSDLSKLRRYDEVGSESPHGLYVYERDSGKWVLTRVDGEGFKPVLDGYYVLYFDNAKCHACRSYDSEWFPYVREASKKLHDHYFIVILCEWFSRKCNSESASKSFKEYDVHASPTTYLLYVRNGSIAYKEKYEGRLNRDELRKVVGEFSVRVEKFERGERVELPKTAEEEVDIAEVIRKLIELLREAGKSERSSTQG